VISVPQPLISHTIARCGEAGREWLARLPELVEELCADWGLTVDGPPTHGGIGLVVPTRRGDEPTVLKLSLGDESTRHEALALETWRGRGAVLLLARDAARDAMPLERLDASIDPMPIAGERAVGLPQLLWTRLDEMGDRAGPSTSSFRRSASIASGRGAGRWSGPSTTGSGG